MKYLSIIFSFILILLTGCEKTETDIFIETPEYGKAEYYSYIIPYGDSIIMTSDYTVWEYNPDFPGGRTYNLYPIDFSSPNCYESITVTPHQVTQNNETCIKIDISILMEGKLPGQEYYNLSPEDQNKYKRSVVYYFILDVTNQPRDNLLEILRYKPSWQFECFQYGFYYVGTMVGGSGSFFDAGISFDSVFLTQVNPDIQDNGREVTSNKSYKKYLYITNDNIMDFKHVDVKTILIDITDIYNQNLSLYNHKS